MPMIPFDRGFYITSHFGPRDGTFHYGTNFGRDGGSGGHSIYATKAGTAVMEGPASGFSQWIVLDHDASVGGSTSA